MRRSLVNFCLEYPSCSSFGLFFRVYEKILGRPLPWRPLVCALFRIQYKGSTNSPIFILHRYVWDRLVASRNPLGTDFHIRLSSRWKAVPTINLSKKNSAGCSRNRSRLYRLLYSMIWMVGTPLFFQDPVSTCNVVHCECSRLRFERKKSSIT